MVRLFLKPALLMLLVAAPMVACGRDETRRAGDGAREPVSTPAVDRERARQVGAEVGERAAVAAGQAERAVAAGTITAKIKGKLALDDRVRAMDIDVDTTGSTVTVTGVVESAAQRDRVLQLAKDTDGVTQVVDRLRIRK